MNLGFGISEGRAMWKRLQSYEERELEQWRREIDEGEPITAKHAQAASIDQEYGKNLVSDADRDGFARTADFGLRFNKALEWGGFRVQEIARTELRLHPLTGPTFGRNYEVYFNRLQMGRLAINADSDIIPGNLIGMYLWLELERPHLLEYGELSSFLIQIANAASDREHTDWDKRTREIDRTLSRVMWEFMRAKNADHLSLEFNQSGPAVWMLNDEFKRARLED
jgi:hypothetical protein